MVQNAPATRNAAFEPGQNSSVPVGMPLTFATLSQLPDGPDYSLRKHY